MLALCALYLAFCAAVHAQAVSASLVGTITDTSGGAVPDSKVTIIETNTGVSRSGQTNESGNYTFSNLRPGVYTVVAERSGFKKASRAGVDVVVDTTVRIDLALQPGEVSETINVTAEAALLKPSAPTPAARSKPRPYPIFPFPAITISRASVF